ncbi:DNA translocase FtsK [Schleiferilactobacillus shenzhenensis]|uniref:DNA translocase FtsK n=1 Tax=Schleiferilactobacillus shenzhenensis LY-73 TaxID=1231336 RepID=U4TNB0_9LACO|nr:DNA translocase FtsK [Schleiferilactobacillus shenzhenensis]ERL66356.1 SftA [Schleiferilactobacillus shenzhenensis LY-73]
MAHYDGPAFYRRTHGELEKKAQQATASTYQVPFQKQSAKGKAQASPRRQAAPVPRRRSAADKTPVAAAPDPAEDYIPVNRLHPFIYSDHQPDPAMVAAFAKTPAQVYLFADVAVTDAEETDADAPAFALAAGDEDTPATAVDNGDGQETVSDHEPADQSSSDEVAPDEPETTAENSAADEPAAFSDNAAMATTDATDEQIEGEPAAIPAQADDGDSVVSGDASDEVQPAADDEDKPDWPSADEKAEQSVDDAAETESPTDSAANGAADNDIRSVDPQSKSFADAQQAFEEEAAPEADPDTPDDTDSVDDPDVGAFHISDDFLQSALQRQMADRAKRAAAASQTVDEETGHDQDDQQSTLTDEASASAEEPAATEKASAATAGTSTVASDSSIPAGGSDQEQDDSETPTASRDTDDRADQHEHAVQTNDTGTDELEKTAVDYSNYRLPAADLLRPVNTADTATDDEWVANETGQLNTTLKAFHVDGSVVHHTVGPTVTQFEIQLAPGVKVSKVTNLIDDLKLALAAEEIRIEAPIPGKRTVGIEIPNAKPRNVALKEIVGSTAFAQSLSPLTVALGIDLFGRPVVADLRKMPHGLIAGSTGSGKSVFINGILLSLLLKATPDQLQLLLIDPKAVELAPYNDLPHLLAPVISDPEEAVAALDWVVERMEQRYTQLVAAGVRNIEEFNQRAKAQHEPEMQMPYIVVVIDELADLMMTTANAVQDSIARLTQKARAAGIHLLIATQRPSVDVLTGVIKNNIPTRIAFMVSSQVDSRTILDAQGAERLLGKGDMLYRANGSNHPLRLQGAYVTSAEIDRVTAAITAQAEADYVFTNKDLKKAAEVTEEEDPLWDQVLDYVQHEDTISTSKLQRLFSIGYNRAANIIDHLEAKNLVSGPHGSKPRKVFYRGEAGSGDADSAPQQDEEKD